jgi:hypothetical protein
MSTLEEDLRELVDLMPGLPGEAMAASQAAAARVAAARPLLDEIEAIDQAADEIVTVAGSLGQAFAKHAHDLEQHLRDTIGEADQSWAAARQAVETAADTTFSAALNSFQAKEALLGTLEAADEAVDPTTAAETATKSLEEASLEALRDINNHGVEIQRLAGEFLGLMGDRISRLNSSTEALQARVDELHDRLADGAASLVTTMAEKARQLDEALRQTLATFAADLEDQRNLTAEQLGDQVGTPIAEAGDGAQQGLAALGSGAETQDRRLIEVRAQFVQAFAELEESVRNVPNTIQEIHEAFEKVDGL